MTYHKIKQRINIVMKIIIIIRRTIKIQKNNQNNKIKMRVFSSIANKKIVNYN